MTSKTGENRSGTFKPGDPRINRKGRPKTLNDVRMLAQGISHEAARAGGQQVVIDGHIATIAEAILRSWAMSKDARLQMAFIEYAYGKPPIKTEMTGANGGPIVIMWGDDATASTD